MSSLLLSGLGRSCGCGLDGLDFELDVHPLADDYATGLECLIPLQAEVAPIDGSLRRECEAVVPPWVLRAAAELAVQDHFACGVADREVTVDAIPLAAQGLDAATLEGQGRKLSDVEEVWLLQVLVAICRSCVDAAGIDRDLHPGLGQVSLVQFG